jgi:hypothetical protein
MNLSEIVPAVRSGIVFWRTALARVWGALGLLTAISLAGVLEAAFGLGWPWVLITSVFELAATILASGALFRLLFSSEGRVQPPGPAGLQWSKVEWRLAGAMLLSFFLILLMALAIVFVTLLVIVALYVGLGAGAVPSSNFLSSPAGAATLAVGGVGGAVMLWVLLRLSLSFPATVDRGVVQVFSVWGLSRGRMAALLVVAVLFGIPIVLRLGLPMLAPNALAAMIQAQGGPAPVLLRAMGSVLGGLVQLPILAGALGFLYRRAAPDRA